MLTIAIAEVILTDGDYTRTLREFGRRYPHAGYGASFNRWLNTKDPAPYNSWGNGAAMRVSPVGWAFDSTDDVLREASRTAEVSHNHPEGIKGAQAAALAVYLARTRRDKELIKKEISQRFGYDLDRTVDGIRPSYSFDISCQGTVPEAIIAFLDGESHEDAVRNAVSLGGDSDTLGCITGAVAEAYFGPLETDILATIRTILPPELCSTAVRFCRKHGPAYQYP